jgi:peroxiredoxin
LLEKRSLFTSAEYLAFKVLNDQSCTLNENVAKQLEGYRKMKKGNQVPNISFGEATYYPSHTRAKSLYDINSNYTLVVFAAGWCGHCTREIPKLAKKYPNWHDKGLEVALIGLDDNPKDFAKFAAPFPFISTTDYQKWESQAVKDFHVYATPTMFLLDKDKNIVLRPKSTEHLEAWVNSYMK